MSLSDTVKGQSHNIRRRGVNQENKPWSDAQKIEAVTLWLSMGNVALVAATLRIPEKTMRKWTYTQWWKEIAEEIRLQDKIVLSASAKNIIDKSLNVIADRLEQGDWIYDQKTGEMRRKPVSMKDALQVADRMLDRKEKLDKTQVVNTSAESVEQKLNKLMEKFSQAAMPAAQITDVIFVKEQENATDENGSEWEESSRLQLRQTVREESGTGEESSGTELSEEDDE